MADEPGQWPFTGDPNSAVGSRHHIVPRFYLERWADPSGHLLVVEKPGGKRVKASIKDAGTEKDFYTYLDRDGRPAGHLEQLLSQIEGKASTAIAHMLHPNFAVFPPSPDEKHDLAIFLAFQAARGRRTRKSIELQADMLARLNLSGLDRPGIAERMSFGQEELSEDRIHEAEEFIANLDEYVFVPDPNEHLGMLGNLAYEIYKRLMRRHWYLCEYNQPVLLTCDEPVALYMSTHDPLRGVGFLNADEVWFPLSPKALLILALNPEPVPSRFEAPSSTSSTVNRLLVENAYQYAFLHPNHDMLPEELPPDRPIFQVSTRASPVLERYNKPPDTKRTERRRRTVKSG